MAVRTVTLAANVVSTVTVPNGEGWDEIGVMHTGNVAGNLYATVNNTDPVVDGNDVYLVASGSRRAIFPSTATNSVRLLSTAAVKVEVEFA